MESLMRWVIRHPMLVLATLIVTTALSIWQLPRLQVHVSPQGLSIADSPDRAAHERSLALFGSDNIVILYVRDPDLFAPQRVDALREAVRRIQDMRCVSHTRSLFSIPHLYEEKEFIHNAPFLEQTPADPAAATALVKQALGNPFVRDNLLSEDGRAMAINIYIRPSADDPRFDERVTRQLNKVTAEFAPLFEQMYFVGAPQIRESIGERIVQDMELLGPYSALLLFVTLALVLRRLSGIVTPLITATVSVVWTLGLMAALGFPINVMTAIVPILLVVIGSTEDIHLVTEYYAGIGKGYGRRRAVQHMVKRMGLAITLTFLTSFLGFLALGFNPIQLVREFVLVAAGGLAISFLVTVMIVPLMLRYLGEQHLKRRPALRHPHRGFNSRLVNFALSNRRWVLLATAAFTLVCVYFASTIRVNNNIMDYLDRKSEISQQIENLQTDLAGLETFNVMVDGHVEGTFQRVRYVTELHKLQEYLRHNPNFDFTASLADYVRVFNSVVDEERLAVIPEEDEVIETLALFVSPERLRPFVTEDYSAANILVRHSLSDSATLNDELVRLEHFIQKEIDPALKVTVTGHSILSNQASDQLAGSQAESLLFMLIVIFGMIAMLFLNIRAGMLAVVPNIFLVVGLFGAMGAWGITLDTGSTMIAAIALGVSVDHTMHLLVRYYSLTRGRVEPGEAIRQAAAIEFRPILAATLSLAAGFLVMGLSSFTPVVNFGLLSAFVMLLALYANFFLTPVLLSYVRLTTLWDVLSMPARQGLRAHCSLFRGLNELQVRHVLSFGTIRSYPVGGMIFDQGSQENELYVLLSGEVRICGDSHRAHRIVTDENPGDRVFGIASLLRGVQQICPAQVMRKAEVLVLDWERLEQLQKFRPRTGSQLFRNLSEIIAAQAMARVNAPEVKLRSVS